MDAGDAEEYHGGLIPATQEHLRMSVPGYISFLFGGLCFKNKQNVESNPVLRNFAVLDLAAMVPNLYAGDSAQGL